RGLTAPSHRSWSASLLRVLLDERERRVGDLAPAAVDRERVTATRDLDELGHARIALLTLVGRLGDRHRDGVILLADDDEQRATIGVLRVDLRLGPRIEVGRCRLEDRLTGAGHR